MPTFEIIPWNFEHSNFEAGHQHSWDKGLMIVMMIIRRKKIVMIYFNHE